MTSGGAVPPGSADDGSCQATLIVHVDGHVVCLDDDCVVVEELHALVLPCTELDEHCCEG